jgi:hypothetical protein
MEEIHDSIVWSVPLTSSEKTELHGSIVTVANVYQNAFGKMYIAN